MKDLYINTSKKIHIPIFLAQIAYLFFFVLSQSSIDIALSYYNMELKLDLITKIWVNLVLFLRDHGSKAYYSLFLLMIIILFISKKILGDDRFYFFLSILNFFVLIAVIIMNLLVNFQISQLWSKFL